MKRLILISALLMCANLMVFSQATIFVSATASGSNNGTSWTNAYNSLQSAIDNITAGDSIFLGKGIYYPSNIIGGGGNPRDKAFLLTKGIRIYGGFSGSESHLADRNNDSTSLFVTNASILSGDLGNQNDSSDNCFHVLLAVNLDSTSVFDGLSIKNANADGQDSIVISGHIIYRYFGGGICNMGGNAHYENLLIKDNIAKLGGAGMLNSSSVSYVGTSSFADNIVWGDEPGGFGGAGMRNVNSDIDINYLSFIGNKAYSIQGGGGIRNENSSPSISNCIFRNNFHDFGDGGAGMYNAMNSNPEIHDSYFNMNSTTDQGGGMYNDNSKPEVFDTWFVDNNGGNGAGAMENDGGSDVYLYNVQLINNHTDVNGGAIQNWQSSPILEYVKFESNTADGDGGALYNYNNCSPTISYSIFENNRTTGNGGAIYNRRNCNPIVTNTLIIRNKAGKLGGGFYTVISNSSPCSPIATNTTIVNNEADSSGGGVYDDGAGSPELRNSIIHGNHAPMNADIHIVAVQPASALTNSIVGNDYMTDALNATPFITPVFVDTSAGILGYQLHKTSYAINRGDSTVFNIGKTPDLSDMPVDLRGIRRILGANVDLGVYEVCTDTLTPSVSLTVSPDSMLPWDVMSITFTAHPVDAGFNPSYIWYKNGTIINGVTGDTYVAQYPIDFDDGDRFSVELISNDDCATTKNAISNSITITILTGFTDYNYRFNNIILYPNPTEGKLMVEFSEKTKGEIVICDVLGNTIYREALNKEFLRSHISLPASLDDGIYLLKFNAGNSTVTKKFILRNE